MSRRRRPDMAEDDEVTGLAGWLYTDLLLGLAVVFLGTISFTVLKPSEPVEGGGSLVEASSTSTSSTTSTTLAPQPCTIHNPGDNKAAFRIAVNMVADVRSQVDEELDRLRELNQLGADSHVAFAIVYGWGSSTGQGEGNARAQWEILKKSLPEVFGTAAAQFIWKTSLRSNEINMDVFLQSGDCNL